MSSVRLMLEGRQWKGLRPLALACLAMLLVSRSLAQTITVAGQDVSFAHVLGERAPGVAALCPPPDTLPDASDLIAAACARVATGKNPRGAYAALAEAYLQRGRRQPPPSPDDAWRGGVALAEMLRHAPPNPTIAGHPLERILLGAGADMARIEQATGDAGLYQGSAEVMLAAAAACPADGGPVCAARNRLHAADVLALFGHWRDDVPVLNQVISIAHAAIAALPRKADERLWVQLHSRASNADLQLIDLTSTPADKLAQQSLDELAEVTSYIEKMPHDEDWSDLMVSMASAQSQLGLAHGDAMAIRLALVRYNAALAVSRPEKDIATWFESQSNLGFWHVKLAQLDASAVDWAIAAGILQGAIDTVARIGASLPLEVANARLVHAMALIGEGREERLSGGRALMQQAADELDAIERVFIAAHSQAYLNILNEWRTYARRSLAR